MASANTSGVSPCGGATPSVSLTRALSAPTMGCTPDASASTRAHRRSPKAGAATLGYAPPGRPGLCQPTRQRQCGRRATRRVHARGDQGVRPPARRGAPTSGSTPGASAGTRVNRRSPGGGGTTCTSGSPRSPRSVAARGGGGDDGGGFGTHGEPSCSCLIARMIAPFSLHGRRAYCSSNVPRLLALLSLHERGRGSG